MARKPAAKNKVYAVLTGDIVGSTKLSSKQLAAVRKSISIVSETVKDIDAHDYYFDAQNWAGDSVEFSRGDSWQVVTANPKSSLRLALMVQAKLRHQTGAETRMAIGIGTVEMLGRSAGVSTGEAFTLSGRALENIGSTFRLTGALPKHSEVLADWFPGILHLCGALTRGWTTRQAEVMGYWLKWPDKGLADATYEWVAEEFKITKQSVGDILSSAQLPSLRDALVRFQKTDWQRVAGPQQERNG